jgi:molybdopterin-binding protein
MKMKLSARNIIKGKVKKVNHGLVSSEVIVGLPNELEIVSIVSKAAVENLNLKEGKEVYAIINASDVILATDY